MKAIIWGMVGNNAGISIKALQTEVCQVAISCTLDVINEQIEAVRISKNQACVECIGLFTAGVGEDCMTTMDRLVRLPSLFVQLSPG